MNDLAYDFEMYDLFCELVANSELEKQLQDFNIWYLKMNQEATSLTNAVTLHEHFKTHGVSQEVQSIFGGEGIFETVGSAVKKILIWVYTKLKQLLSFFSDLILNILNIPVEVVRALIRSAKGLNNVQIQYDVTRMSTDNGVAGRIPTLTDDDVSSAHAVYERILKHWWGVSDTSELFTKLPDGQTMTYKISDLEKTLGTIETIAAILNTWSTSIQKIIKDILPKLDSIIKRNNAADVVKVTREFKEKVSRFFTIDSSIDDNDPKYPVYLTNIMAGAHMLSANVAPRMKSMLEDIRRAVMRERTAIHMSFPFDRGLRKHLSDQYKLPLRVERLIITNSSPETWDTSIKGATMGWCIPLFGQSSPGVSDGADAEELWINWTFISKWINRWVLAHTNSGSVSPEHSLLSIIAHECKHLADGQAGRKFNMNSTYGARDHEKDANKEASKYEPTKSELAWAKMIIAKVREEEKRQKAMKQ